MVRLAKGDQAIDIKGQGRHGAIERGGCYLVYRAGNGSG